MKGPGTTYTLRVSHGGVGSILRGEAGREEVFPRPWMEGSVYGAPVASPVGREGAVKGTRLI